MMPNNVFVLPAWCLLVFGQCDHFAHQTTDVCFSVCVCLPLCWLAWLLLSELPRVQARGLVAREHCATYSSFCVLNWNDFEGVIHNPSSCLPAAVHCQG